MKNIFSIKPYLQYAITSYDDFYYQEFDYDTNNDQIIGLKNPVRLRKQYDDETLGIDMNYLIKSNLHNILKSLD